MMISPLPERMELLEAAAADRELAGKLYPMLWLEPWLADCLNTDGEGFVRRMQHEMAHGDDGEDFVRRVMDEYHCRMTTPATTQGAGVKGRSRRRFWLGAVCAASLAVIGMAVAFLARPGQNNPAQNRPGKEWAGKGQPSQESRRPDALTTARLESLQGDVTIVGPSGNRAEARLDQSLLPGERIQTGDEASVATLRYADGTRLELNAATRLEIVARNRYEWREASEAHRRLARCGRGSAGRSLPHGHQHTASRDPRGWHEVSFQRHRATHADRNATRASPVAEPSRRPVDRCRRGANGGRRSTGRGHRSQATPPMLAKPKIVLPDPEGPVLSIDYSPDGRTLAVGGWDGTLTLWDVATGKARHTIATHSQGGIISLAFSPDGQTVATLCYGDTSVKLWDVATGNCRRTLSRPASERKHLAAPQKLAFANGGSSLIVGGAQVIYLWDPEQGRELAKIPQADNNLCTLAYSSVAKILATGHLDGAVRLWDIDQRKLLDTLPAHTKRVNCVAFSADGTTLASGSNDRTVKLWDLKTRTVRRTIEANLRPVRSVAFSADGIYLASGCSERMIRLWETRTGREAQLFEGTDYAYPNVKFSPDGKTLATAGWKKKVELWSLPGK